jgi:hypothetical protein
MLRLPRLCGFATQGQPGNASKSTVSQVDPQRAALDLRPLKPLHIPRLCLLSKKRKRVDGASDRRQCDIERLRQDLRAHALHLTFATGELRQFLVKQVDPAAADQICTKLQAGLVACRSSLLQLVSTDTPPLQTLVQAVPDFDIVLKWVLQFVQAEAFFENFNLDDDFFFEPDSFPFDEDDLMFFHDPLLPVSAPIVPMLPPKPPRQNSIRVPTMKKKNNKGKPFILSTRVKELRDKMVRLCSVPAAVDLDAFRNFVLTARRKSLSCKKKTEQDHQNFAKKKVIFFQIGFGACSDTFADIVSSDDKLHHVGARTDEYGCFSALFTSLVDFVLENHAKSL